MLTFTKRHRNLAITSAIILVLVVGILVVVRKLSGAAVGKVDPVTAEETQAKPADEIKYTHWEGTYAAFDYNATYKPDKQQLGPNTLERIGLVGGAQGTRYIALMAEKSTTGRLDDSSSVHFRQLNPSTYKMEAVKINGRDGLVFTNNKEGYEKAAFVAGKGSVISLTLTSSSGSPEDLNKEFDQLINSLKIK